MDGGRLGRDKRVGEGVAGSEMAQRVECVELFCACTLCLRPTYHCRRVGEESRRFPHQLINQPAGPFPIVLEELEE